MFLSNHTSGASFSKALICEDMKLLDNGKISKDSLGKVKLKMGFNFFNESDCGVCISKG